MAIPILMPKVDMVMESGTFVEWLKNEGDRIEKGQPLFVILTDKATIEVEAEHAGILSGVSAKTDDILPVAAVIGYIAQPGEAVPGISPDIHSTIAAAKDHAVLRATPLARKFAREMQVDLQAVQGSGPRGRIYRADIERLLEKGNQAGPSEESTFLTPLAQTSRIPMALPIAKEKQRIALKGAQKIVSERLTYSFTHIPHVYVSMQVDMTEAIRMRRMLMEDYQKRLGIRLSYTAIIALAVCQSLARHTSLNSSLLEDTIYLWEDVHLGIATDVDGQLVVPVLLSAHTRNLEELALALDQLVEKAASKKLLPVEMSGSTFSISNLGMLGVSHFTAIINPPETAILAVGQIQEIPAAKDGKLEIAPMMDLTLAVDHRVTNGAQAARFLTDLKSNLETPYRML
jgi:pyruvate dehydrogenase E2 component (dihydrolipoamide acetyltransferase)